MTTVYIGPYLVIPPLVWPTTKTARVCAGDCAHPVVSPRAKFCGNCGSEIRDTSTQVEELKPLPIHALADKWTDFMFCPPYGQLHPKGAIWLPNRGRHGIKLDRGAEFEHVPLALTALDGPAMLENAERAYAAFVAALNADFNITPCWEVGLIAYGH